MMLTTMSTSTTTLTTTSTTALTTTSTSMSKTRDDYSIEAMQLPVKIEIKGLFIDPHTMCGQGC